MMELIRNIALFSLVPILMAILSILGYTVGIEPLLWSIFAFGTGVTLTSLSPKRLLLNSLMIGISWGLLSGLIQAMFFITYLANNPQIAAEFKEIDTMSPRLLPIIAGPIMGLFVGFVIYPIAWMWKRHQKSETN